MSSEAYFKGYRCESWIPSFKWESLEITSHNSVLENHTFSTSNCKKKGKGQIYATLLAQLCDLVAPLVKFEESCWLVHFLKLETNAIDVLISWIINIMDSMINIKLINFSAAFDLKWNTTLKKTLAMY